VLPPPLYSPSEKRHYCSSGDEGQRCSTFNEIIAANNNYTPQNLDCIRGALTSFVSLCSQVFLHEERPVRLSECAIVPNFWKTHYTTVCRRSF
jgi:hypothetical protein